MKTLAYICRFLLGIVFVFSGFVKAVDPWGSQFKFEDYFIAFGMDWLMPYALVLGIMLSAAEFLIGAAFLFGIKPKLSTWSAVAFMALFLPVTLILALYDVIDDCGCFGDAIKLTNWETFYKNIVIVAMLVPVFLYRKKFKHYIGCKLEWIPVFIFAAGIVYTSVYGLRHLPVIDFLPYHPGLSVKPDPAKKDKYFVTYKDKTSGEEKEYPADNYPWDDTTWMAGHEFVSQRVEPGQTPALLISPMDAEGNSMDRTTNVFLNPEFQMLIVAWDLENVHEKAFVKMLEIINECQSDSVDVALLTATPSEKAEKIKSDKKIPAAMLYADDIALKQLVRNNPGFVLMKDGTLLAKWAWRDVPSLKNIDMPALEAKYVKK